MKKISLAVVLLIIAFQANALLCLNDVDIVFSDGPGKLSINDNVVSGATYFLLSKSNADLLLMEYEKSAVQNFDFSLHWIMLKKPSMPWKLQKLTMPGLPILPNHLGKVI
ncbi:MAG: hypothetical protein GY757_26590 [bacterium]|nr:hypothetical protein [bacterium]